MCVETRFWIVQIVAVHQSSSYVIRIYQDPMKLTEKNPKCFISEGAVNFYLAYKMECCLNKQNLKHIRQITLREDHNNNERKD